MKWFYKAFGPTPIHLLQLLVHTPICMLIINVFFQPGVQVSLRAPRLFLGDWSHRPLIIKKKNSSCFFACNFFFFGNKKHYCRIREILCRGKSYYNHAFLLTNFFLIDWSHRPLIIKKNHRAFLSSILFFFEISYLYIDSWYVTASCMHVPYFHVNTQIPRGVFMNVVVTRELTRIIRK